MSSSPPLSPRCASNAPRCSLRSPLSKSSVPARLLSAIESAASRTVTAPVKASAVTGQAGR